MQIVLNRSYPTDDGPKAFLWAITGRIVRIWRPKATPFPHPRESRLRAASNFSNSTEMTWLKRPVAPPAIVRISPKW